MNLGVLAGVLSLSAFFPYLYSMLRHKTKPNKVTWWVWSWLGILLFFSYRATGAVETLWVPMVYIVTPLATAILSIWYGEGGWGKLDIMCLIGSVLGTLFWFVSKSPGSALLFFLAVDFCGLLPTIKKTYFDPGSEDKTAWLIMVVANAVNLYACGGSGILVKVYPLYLLVSGGVILGLTFKQSRKSSIN